MAILTYFKNIRISLKIIGSFLLVISLLTFVFYKTNQKFQERDINEMAISEINHVKDFFIKFQEHDTKMLASTIETIAADQKIKDIYLQQNRDKLYEYNRSLFDTLKNKYGITHWYFISPDGSVFLRMDNKDVYGDEVKSNTFIKTRDTKQTSSGIELGKTSYALRVVVPYFDKGELIGYLEMGEDMNEFLEILKKYHGEEFFIVVDKKFLNRNEWASFRKLNGLRDNWDDLDKHLFISSTTEELDIRKVTKLEDSLWKNIKKIFGFSDNIDITRTCSVENNFKNLEQSAVALGPLNNNTFSCAGFSFTDAGGNYSGIILTSIGITEQIATVKKNNQEIGLISLVFFIISLIISFLISRPIVNSIKNLSQVALDIVNGDLKKRVEIRSEDELGILANSFNTMTDSLVKSVEDTKIILETMPEPLLVLDEKGIIKMTNEATYTMLQYEKGTLIGKSVDDIIIYPEEENNK